MHNFISPLNTAELPFFKKRKVVLLGSTGSIGVSALQVILEHPDLFQVMGLAGAKNASLLARQAAQFRPAFLAVLTEEVRGELLLLLKDKAPEYCPEILVGQKGYIALAGLEEVHTVLAAQVGAAGLKPALAAAEKGKTVALANKEALVLAGHLFRDVCHKTEAVILPVDSEHNALFQALVGQEKAEIRRLILTASGGPFREYDKDRLSGVTVEQALCHPNWSMGAKISIDSATLMNKGLEVIEAYHLFGVKAEQIEVVVHPQSIVHSLVEYTDCSLLAQLGPPDMRIAISFALGWPRRLPLSLKPLDLVAVGQLDFEAPRPDIFPCLQYAFDCLLAGPSYPVVLNAANEVAVELFLNGAISFGSISQLIKQVLDKHTPEDVSSLEGLLALDSKTRKRTREIAKI